MSVLVQRMMTNHHEASAFQELVQQVRLWRRRAAERAELARWSERELHDVGLSWADVAGGLEKPFWRA